MKRLSLALLALALLASRAAADEQRGLQLVRDAQAAMAAGDNEHAVELLKQARVEWPGAPLVANTLADALRELGRYPEALTEYTRGQSGELAHHAQFNRAVTRHLLAEQLLEQAGVPADPAALPEGPQPEMLAAIEQASGELTRATDEFLESLERQPDEAARESIEALGRRTEALTAMAEELRRRQEQQQKDQDKQDQKDQKDPKDQQDQKDKDQQDQQDQKPDPQQQDQQNQDQQQQDQQQDEKEQQQQKEEKQKDEQQKQDEQKQQAEPKEGEPQGEGRELSPEEVQQLLDRLDQLEQQARELQKAREALRRRPVEKDW